MKDFRNLEVWKKSHEAVLEVYRCTGDFPKEEKYGIVNQLRRAVVSIPTNIAEGCGRGGDTEFRYFIQIAFGSANESEYLLILSKDLNYLESAKFNAIIALIQEVKKMLSGLIKSIKKQ